jgi:hypothetical protein
MTMPTVHCAHDAMVPLAELHPNPRNRNTHPKKQIKMLAKIFMENGIRRPITVSKRSGLMTIGHGRLFAARLLKMDSYPVDWQDYESDEHEMADMLADNIIPELSEMDVAGMEEDRSLLEVAGFDLEIAGFDNIDQSHAPEIIQGKDVLDGSNYTNIQSSRYSINLFGIGGFVPRENGDVIKNRLITMGAVEGEDNSDVIEKFFDEILSVQ